MKIRSKSTWNAHVLASFYFVFWIILAPSLVRCGGNRSFLCATRLFSTIMTTLKLKRSPRDAGLNLTSCCIICLKPNDLTSTENGRKKILETANARKDEVHQRLLQVEGPFKYHLDNYQCYKRYTRKESCTGQVSKTYKYSSFFFGYFEYLQVLEKRFLIRLFLNVVCHHFIKLNFFFNFKV